MAVVMWYDCCCTEAGVIRKLYLDMLIPKLAAHQKLILVPGTFADGNRQRSGSLAAQDNVIAQKLEAYFQWMQEDERVVGLNAYHWLNEGKANDSGWVPPGDAWLGEGLMSLPQTQALLAKITAIK